jgi:hypothetical protein
MLAVIEMNNEANRVEGIGYVINKPWVDRYYRVYENANYNRYMYLGKKRLDRSELDPELLCALEFLLFKGKSHSKRGSGLTKFPPRLLYTDTGRVVRRFMA